MRVITEETIATCEPPNNGSGPLWCYLAPLLTRTGTDVYASIMETGADVPPLCNTRPRLYRKRGTERCQLVWAPPAFREREPCPLVTLGQGRLFLSVNTSVMPPGTYYGKCKPALLEFSRNTLSTPKEHTPPFPQTATFTDHSYRGIAADSQRDEILLLHIDAQTSEYHYALRKHDGSWDPPGVLAFPIRACYPQVALRHRVAHVLAIGDIYEPVEEWRRYKRERTQREWDYVFRQLFYTWTPHVPSEPFRPPLEIDNVDTTGGHIMNLDLWLDKRGVAHLLYLRQQTTSLLREIDISPTCRCAHQWNTARCRKDACCAEADADGRRRRSEHSSPSLWSLSLTRWQAAAGRVLCHRARWYVVQCGDASATATRGGDPNSLARAVHRILHRLRTRWKTPVKDAGHVWGWNAFRHHPAICGSALALKCS
jgi:hypothetical protein